MNRNKPTSTIILALIALIFGVDAVLNATGYATISENVTGWVQGNPTNLVLLLTGVGALCVHWIWGYYKEK
jgi:hypothetical protein